GTVGCERAFSTAGAVSPPLGLVTIPNWKCHRSVGRGPSRESTQPPGRGKREPNQLDSLFVHAGGWFRALLTECIEFVPAHHSALPVHRISPSSFKYPNHDSLSLS